MVNRVFAHGDALDGEHGEVVLLVVIAGVVAVGAFECSFVGMNHALEHNLGSGGYLQIAADAFHQFGARAAQQAGELIFAQSVGYGRYRAENGGGVAAEHHGNGVGRTGVFFAERLIIQRAAAMGEPAHDEFVFAEQLLAVDTEILPFFVRSARYG